MDLSSYQNAAGLAFSISAMLKKNEIELFCVKETPSLSHPISVKNKVNTGNSLLRNFH